MLLPGLCAARWAVEARRPLLRVGLGAVIFCSLLVSKDIVKARIYTLIHWYGLISFGDLLLGILIGGMLWRLGNRGAGGESIPIERLSPPEPIRKAA
jgi:Na+/proline symporter